MKELFIIRHAKSSWKDTTLSDFDRPLNKRGERDAPEMGRRLKSRNLIPDFILSSPANRARSTAEVIAEETEYTADIHFDKSIYEASAVTLMDCINEIDDKHSRVFLFGHNPGFSYLAERLAGENIGNLPTCGIVGLRFELDSWKMISADTGSIFYFDYPKNKNN